MCRRIVTLCGYFITQCGSFCTWFWSFILWCCGMQKTLICYVSKRDGIELNGADVALWGKLKTELARRHRYSLRILNIDEMPRDQDAVVFILCTAASRLVSDVSSALKGIYSEKNMVLLVFRAVAPHIQHGVESKELLLEQMHTDLGDIIDVFLSTESGALNLKRCQQNCQAVTRICKFIAQHDSRAHLL